ncbi:hypothetical protein MFLAVUS_001837 [Mucor flavus]|uniref:Uncharacterized protein n=1 Tax=Mucor flavus TaxID=439312 RepID=A0ABP9YNL0_9FUNG
MFSSVRVDLILKQEKIRLRKNTDTLSFDKTVRAEDTLGSINGSACPIDDYKLGHSSSISLALKKVGGEIRKQNYLRFLRIVLSFTRISKGFKSLEQTRYSGTNQHTFVPLS